MKPKIVHEDGHNIEEAIEKHRAAFSCKSQSAGSVTWDEAVKKLRYCDCGAPIFEFTDDTGTDDWQRFAECSFCDFVTESHWEPQVVLDQWNNRGGKCEECETGICETDEDEICNTCWNRAKSPNR